MHPSMASDFTTGSRVKPLQLKRLAGLTIVDWLALGLLGLLVQGYWGLRLDGPTYMDASYYATNGRRLAAGEGFTELVI